MKVHLIGVGGVGMAGLAVLLKARGRDVSGCDLKPTPRTRWLEAQGVTVAYGHDPRHVDGVDETIATPAVPADDPERLAARAVTSRGAALAALVNDGDSVAVCGSHGKTTTATFTAKLLIALGERVEWAIGGETGDFPVAGSVPGDGTRPRVLVVEADESDGTLALYRAKTLVVTNCEYDHPDHFKTPEAYFACYAAAKAQAETVIESETLAPLEAIASALAPLAPHNRKNARAAAEVALRRGHAPAAVAAALAGAVAALPDRRFQTVRQDDGRTVVTDYAHHPTEMACAVSMAREICTGTLRVLFQPHRYSRTKALLKDFPAAFAGADETVICPTYAAFEKPLEGGGAADLYAACRAASPEKAFFLARSCDEAWNHARLSMEEGDVTLILGAGDIVSVLPRVRAWDAPPVVRRWIGAGSNTWKSDLKTGEEYVRTQGRADQPGASLGIPWMAGIPGTVGGWIKMNAGAFGHSISEVLARVKIDGVWRDAADCGFGYRTSAINGEIQDFELKGDMAFPSAVATSATLPEAGSSCRTLAGATLPEAGSFCRARAGAALPEAGSSCRTRGSASFPETGGYGVSAADYLARRPKFPAGTKGSVFKNPPNLFAGALLESAGCKGLRVGGAYVWENHANVIVSGPGATASDFLALARIMRARVRFRLGVDLEPEVRGLV